MEIFFCSTVWNVQGNKFQINFRFLSFSLSSPLSLHWLQVRDAAGDTELGDSGMNSSSELKCNSHLESSVACAICHCQVLFRLFLYCGVYFKFCCCALLGVQGTHCTDSSTCWALLARYSAALAKLTLDRCALSIVASQSLVSWGGCFVWLAAGQRSLSCSVTKAVTPMGEQGPVVWQSWCRSAVWWDVLVWWKLVNTL